MPLSADGFDAESKAVCNLGIVETEITEPLQCIGVGGDQGRRELLIYGVLTFALSGSAPSVGNTRSTAAAHSS